MVNGGQLAYGYGDNQRETINNYDYQNTNTNTNNDNNYVNNNNNNIVSPDTTKPMKIKLIGRKLKLNYMEIKGTGRLDSGGLANQLFEKLAEKLHFRRRKRASGDSSMLGQADKVWQNVKSRVKQAGDLANTAVKTMSDRIKDSTTG
ncbi:lon protease homolog, mitochondrial 1-like [Oppia nitens]|uniref:lon protease homolog, mitochondrial 1-like n=1 Tax=Oppia nitens TaxID=1686743 RepID=UPI0023DB68B9|nr:lon protease homolog, mitochondrial 1-like [Oppia nitens]